MENTGPLLLSTSDSYNLSAFSKYLGEQIGPSNNIKLLNWGGFQS